MEKTEFLEEIITQLHELGYYLHPCTKDEVNYLETFYNITLPKAYKEFLYSMGKSAGEFMVGSRFFYHDLPHIREALSDFLHENNLPELNKNAFPFWSHQGYIIGYFIVGEGDNPPVYILSEESEEDVVMEKKIESFTKFLENELTMYR